MTKTLLIFLTFVVLGGGYAIYMEKKLQENNIAQNFQELKNKEDSLQTGKKIAFSEFIKQGGTYQCSVVNSLSDMENSGTVYIGGDKMKGEFSTIAEGINVESNVVVRDGSMYWWQASSTTGMQTEFGTEIPDTYTWNPNQIGDYDCKPWAYDEVKFALPASIKFIKY